MAGEVDVHTTPVLAEALDHRAGNGTTSVIVDRTECSFLDSTGLEVLVAVNTRLRSSGRRLALVAPDRQRLRVLELAGLEAFFAIYGSRAQALAPDTESSNDEARRRVSIRGVNEQLERACVGLGSGGADEFVFICECGARACTALLHLSLAEYESVRACPARFVIAQNHENPEAEPVVRENGRFAVVETVTGELSKPALESNPRWQRGKPW